MKHDLTANYLQSNNSSKERKSVEDCLSRFICRAFKQSSNRRKHTNRCSKHSNRVQTQSKHPQTICKAVKLRKSVDHDLDRFSSKRSNRVQIEGNIQDCCHQPTLQGGRLFISLLSGRCFQTKSANQNSEHTCKPKFRTHLLSNNRKLPKSAKQ